MKEATGDDTITVRGLYADPITFKPSFKLFMGTNYKPEVRGTDPGIWRRIRLVPFLARFWSKTDEDAPPDGPFKDPMMLAKLRAELPGVLAWAVRGCLEWQRMGLNPPAVVMEATEHYRAEMDTLGHFLEETCVFSPGGRVEMAHLYDAYTRWCADAGHQPMAKVKLGRKLTERGLENAPGSTSVRARSGLYLRPNWLPRGAGNAGGYEPEQGRFGDMSHD